MAKITSIDAPTLKNWLEEEKAVLIDVREAMEYNAQHIAEAYHIPLGKLNLDSLPDVPGKSIVFHCHSGKRSEQACQKILQTNPHLEVFNLKGGILAWIEQGYPTESRGNCSLPLDRQVQIGAGLGILSGVILGYAVSPLFFMLSGFMGAGLIFAGLTGWCGLGILLDKMPWNKR